MIDLINQYRGKCLILGCGPSLKELSVDRLEELAKTHCIFAIKQAYNLYPELIDFHFINDNNYSRYDYSRSNCKVVAEFPLNHFVSSIADTADYIFRVDNSDFTKSLTVTHDFDGSSLPKEIRPWGPGIMYELVLFFAQALGFTELYTYGWDLGPPGSQTRDHFYDYDVMAKAFPMSQQESDREIELSLAFYKWLKSKGVNLSICSTSYAHEEIPRQDAN